MRVSVIPILVGALGTVTKSSRKGLEELEIRGSVETNQTTALLRSAKYRGEYWRYGKTYVTQMPVKDHQLTLVLKLARRKIISRILLSLSLDVYMK